MKVAGSIYSSQEGVAVALYNSYRDIYSALPPGLDGQHAMHIKYDFKNQHNSIDVYLIAPSSVDYIKDNINLKNIFHSSDSGIKLISGVLLPTLSVFHQQNVKIEAISGLEGKSTFSDLTLDSVRDIENFCRSPANKIDDSESLIWVPKIIPVTEVRYNKVKKPVTSGKSDYVDCKFDANYDFMMAKAECVSSFVPSLDSAFTFIPSTGSTFKDAKFIGFYHDKSGDCAYCYAAHHHLVPYPKGFVKFDPEELYDILMYGKFANYNDVVFGKHVDVLRLGKRTEPGAMYHRKQLLDIMEVCIRSKTDLDIPTKYLDYDQDVVELCNKARANGVKINILHSITYLDDLERGPTIHGCDNKWRIEQNKLYANAGVNASLFMMTELVYDTRQEVLDTIQYALDEGLTLQLLGARITKKDVAQRITGRIWEQLKGPLRTEPQMHLGQTRMIKCGGYDLTGNTQLSPQEINPQLLDIIGKNHRQVRLCQEKLN